MTEDFQLENYDFGNSPLGHSVQDAIDALQDGENETGSAVAYGLSDITAEELAQFQRVWVQLDAKTRYMVVEHLTDISESNFELDYRAVGHLALDDEDVEVRIKAIDLLWTDDSTQLLEKLVHMARWDTAPAVRAKATGDLGRFILLGEYGDIRPRYSQAAQETAIDIWTNVDEQVDVRRRALEAISNSSHPIVSEVISEGYNSHDERMTASAVYGMGRSCDERWASTVLQELSSENPEMRYEAARASGQLELETAVPVLARLALSNERDVQEAAVWSLGEIGGSRAGQALEKLSEALTDEDWQPLIEDAISNANLGHGLPTADNILGFDDA